MVEEILVGNSLTSEMIDSGIELIRLLDNNKFGIDAALWLYLPDISQWRLVLAMPKVNSRGPKSAYKKVQSVLNNMPTPKLSLQNIHILDSTDKFIALLKLGIRTGDGISGIRFTSNTINGILIEDAYIYRLL